METKKEKQIMFYHQCDCCCWWYNENCDCPNFMKRSACEKAQEKAKIKNKQMIIG